MVAKWRRSKDSRPGDIVAAALLVFSEKGFAGARIEEIARRAGVSKGTVYLYFEAKSDIFRAVVQDAVIPNIAEIETMVLELDLPFADLLRMLLPQFATLVTERPVGAVAKMVIGESRNFPELARVWHDEVISRGLAMLSALVERGQTARRDQARRSAHHGLLDHGADADGHALAGNPDTRRRRGDRSARDRPPACRNDPGRPARPGEADMNPQRLVVLVLAGFAILFLAWRLLAPSEARPQVFSGYIEGETLYLSAATSGRVQELEVRRGQRVPAGMRLFLIEPDQQPEASEASSRPCSSSAGRCCSTRMRDLRMSLAVLGVTLWSIYLTHFAIVALGGQMNFIMGSLSVMVMVFTLGIAVHVLDYYTTARDEKHPDPLGHALRESVWPCLLSTLTTLLGLISLNVSSIKPVCDFGYAAALGAVIAVVRRTRLCAGPDFHLAELFAEAESDAESLINFSRWGGFIGQHRWSAIGLGALLMVISAFGISLLVPRLDPVDFLPRENLVRRDLRRIEQELTGANSIEAIVDFGVKDTPFVKRLETVRDMQKLIASHPAVRHTLSIASFFPEGAAGEPAGVVAHVLEAQAGDVQQRPAGAGTAAVADFRSSHGRDAVCAPSARTSITDGELRSPVRLPASPRCSETPRPKSLPASGKASARPS